MSDGAEILRLQTISKIFDGYVMLILVGIGTVGNLLNIFVFIRLKMLRQMPTPVFMITSNIGSLILFWSSRFPRCILNITGIDLLVGSIFYCKVRWLLGRWSLNMPFTCICLASIDRFFNTSRNVRYHHFFTLKRAYSIVIIFSLVYLIIFIPDAIYYSGYSCTASAKDRATYKDFVAYFNLIATNILSMIILGIFSLLTWYNLCYGTSVGRNRLQQQVNRMMMVEFAMAFVTTLPNFIYNIYAQATQSTVKSQLRLTQESLWSTVSATINFTIHAGTFYMYMVVSPAYRRNVRRAMWVQKQNHVIPQKVQLQNLRFF
ncbi:hypothetical protein I4U23_011463 [Adineta vaga]|nr:hypothetical protein I4U23_011463 [Adineta vaga]